MCSVSAITPVMQQQWPSIQTLPFQDLVSIRDVLNKLDALDKKLGAPACKEDAPKDAFIQELADRISVLEKRVGA